MDKTKEHNQRLADELQAYHDRRCKESPAYRRCIEKRRKRMEETGKSLQEIMIAESRLRSQTVVSNDSQPIRNTIPDNCNVQKVQNHMNASPFDEILKNPFGALILGVMFMTDEQRRELEEEKEAWKEIHQIEDEYDRRMIHKSGFEW